MATKARDRTLHEPASQLIAVFRANDRVDRGQLPERSGSEDAERSIHGLRKARAFLRHCECFEKERLLDDGAGFQLEVRVVIGAERALGGLDDRLLAVRRTGTGEQFGFGIAILRGNDRATTIDLSSSRTRPAMAAYASRSRLVRPRDRRTASGSGALRRWRVRQAGYSERARVAYPSRRTIPGRTTSVTLKAMRQPDLEGKPTTDSRSWTETPSDWTAVTLPAPAASGENP
jgi:hypothetical protein